MSITLTRTLPGSEALLTLNAYNPRHVAQVIRVRGLYTMLRFRSRARCVIKAPGVAALTLHAVYSWMKWNRYHLLYHKISDY